MALLQFKFDESYDGRFMTIGGWLAEENEWRKLEASWKRCIDKLNKKHELTQQISRFHATDMNGHRREFEHWTPTMSAHFASQLIGFINKRRIVGFTIGADMDALNEAFPKSHPKRKDYAYVLCIKTAMVEIAHVMVDHRPGDTVHLVHDHGNWDQAALAGYNLMVDDERWDKRSLFEGITPLTNAASVGLQAADLIAFEGHKALRGKLVHNSATLRKAMQAIVKKRIPVLGKYVDKDAAFALRRIMEESGRYDFETVSPPS